MCMLNCACLQSKDADSALPALFTGTVVLAALAAPRLALAASATLAALSVCFDKMESEM